MLSDGIQEWGYSLKNGTLRISPKFLKSAMKVVLTSMKRFRIN